MQSDALPRHAAFDILALVMDDAPAPASAPVAAAAVPLVQPAPDAPPAAPEHSGFRHAA